jgi:3-methyladenine DNA glycosylase AlkD
MMINNHTILTKSTKVFHKKTTQLIETEIINDNKVREEVLEHIVHHGVNWSYVDVDNVEFVGGLSVSDEKLRDIESQSDCYRWFEERSQIITTSNFGTILKRRKKYIQTP